MKKFRMNLISLMVLSLSLSGCKSYDPAGEELYRIDMELNECREYLTAQSKPELIFQLKQKLPLKACNNMWAVKNKTMARVVREWNANQKKDETKEVD